MTGDRPREHLRILEQTFSTIIGHSNDGIVLADENGAIVEWNFAQEMMTGIPRDRAIGGKTKV
jgi:PAS domain S-box-containing protein